MKIVLDASASVELAMNRGLANEIGVVIRNSDEILSTELFKAEVGNTMAKYGRGGFIKPDEAIRLAESCLSLIDTFVPIQENLIESVSEAIRLNHSVYDLLYLSLARRNGAVLVTLDKKLKNLAEAEGVKVFPE